MDIWIRIYPAIEVPEGQDLSTSYNLDIKLAAALFISVYRTEQLARDAAEKYGGLVLHATTEVLKDLAIEKDYFYLSDLNEDDYLPGKPLLPTRIACTIVAAIKRMAPNEKQNGVKYPEFSDEDRNWLNELEQSVDVPIYC